jgi:hypothetical protein
MIDLGLFGNTDDVVNVQIGRDGLFASTHQVRLIGLETMQREAVLVGVDGHGANTHFGSGAQYPYGNFTAIGDKDAFDLFHGASWSNGQEWKWSLCVRRPAPLRLALFH